MFDSFDSFLINDILNLFDNDGYIKDSKSVIQVEINIYIYIY